jgi:hypothetical protein
VFGPVGAIGVPLGGVTRVRGARIVTDHGRAGRWFATADHRCASPDQPTHLIRFQPGLVPRLGKKKALVALEHSILTAAWHMLADDVDYHDLGGDYFIRLDPERAMRRLVRQANALGFTIRFDPIPGDAA